MDISELKAAVEATAAAVAEIEPKAVAAEAEAGQAAAEERTAGERLSAAIEARDEAVSEEDAASVVLRTALDNYQATANRRAVATEEAEEAGEAYAIAAVKSRLAAKTAAKTAAEAAGKRKAKAVAERRLAEAAEAAG